MEQLDPFGVRGGLSRSSLRRAAWAVPLGVGTGFATFVFLVALRWVIAWQRAHMWSIWLLAPIGGLLGWVLSVRPHWARDGLAITVGTLVSHLGGASVGREGTAVALAGRLASDMKRRVGVDLAVPSVAAGFAAVFGVPLAGTAFALERADRPERDLGTVLAAALAAVVGHGVVLSLGLQHDARPRWQWRPSTWAVAWRDLAVAALIGLVCLAAAHAYGRGVRLAGSAAERIASPALRLAAVGAVASVVLLIIGPRFGGLSLPLAEGAFVGSGSSGLAAAAIKLAITAWCVGGGFFGGEVTPLFVAGAATGSGLAGLFGVSPIIGASVGFGAIFADRTKAPITGVLLTLEVFGPTMALLASVAAGAGVLAARAAQ